MLRRFSLALLAATTLGGIATQGASAADILRKAPPPAPVAPPVQDWSGVYVGVEGGYGWGHQSFSSAVPWHANANDATCVNGNGALFAGSCTDSGSDLTDFLGDPLKFANPDAIPFSGQNQSGGVIGGFFGVQKQWGSWVLGVEGSADYAHISNSTSGGFTNSTSFRSNGNNIPLPVGSPCGGTDEPSCSGRFTSKTNTIGQFTSTIDEIAAVNAKVGYALSPQWMVYGTGGMAVAHEKNSFSFANELFHLDCDSGSFVAGDFGCNGNTGEFVPGNFSGFTRTVVDAFSGSGGTTMFGWTAGGGIDFKWQIDQGSAWV